MTKPTIHTNGTSAESLMNAYVEAYSAVNAAIKALSEASPNGRDYYPQGDTAITAAVNEHRARLRALEDVSSDMLELAQHCQEFVKE